MKRSYYFAQRIPANAQEDQILPIASDMKVSKIHDDYIGKCIECDNYISNGPWILRPIVKEGIFHSNNFPNDIVPYDVWNMVRCKIGISNVLVAVIDSMSFGTIIEAGFSAGLGTIAVYVLPCKKMTNEEIRDLWLVFQASLQTRHLWKKEDFTNTPIFSEYGIANMEEYVKFVSSIVPNFLSRR